MEEPPSAECSDQKTCGCLTDLLFGPAGSCCSVAATEAVLTLQLLESTLQLVVVEGGRTREPGAWAGAPDGAEAGAGTPARAGRVGWAGASRGRGQGAGIVQGGGEGSGGESAGEAALELHDSPQGSRHGGARHTGREEEENRSRTPRPERNQSGANQLVSEGFRL